MRILIPLVFLLISGCYREGDDLPATPTGPACDPAGLVVEASAVDLVAGDGIGNVTATDTTSGAASWLWTFTGCTPGTSGRRTDETVCPLGAAGVRWTLTVSDAGGCTYDGAGNTGSIS